MGDRSYGNAVSFMEDVAGRLANWVQLTSDGHPMLLTAVENTVGLAGVDYAILVQTYGQPTEKDASLRYSPPVCTGADKHWVMENPDKELVSMRCPRQA